MLRLICSMMIVLIAHRAVFAAESPATQYEVTTWHIGGPGRWDYITVDANSANGSTSPAPLIRMVLDTTTGKPIADIPGQLQNHGVAIAADVGRGFISDGKDASVTIFDLKTNEILGKIHADDDADGIIYDPASHKILVVCGDAGVMVPIAADVDPKTGKADPAVELGGKPEFLAADGHGKAFINLEDKDEIAVVDTKTMKVLNKWPVAPGGSPVGLGIDRKSIGCSSAAASRRK